jgi:hypothetical protein
MISSILRACRQAHGAGLNPVNISSAGRLTAGKKPHYHGRGAADAFAYIERLRRAILRACAAFHAAVFIRYLYLASAHLEHAVRAYFETYPAPGAFIFMQSQLSSVFKILLFHVSAPFISAENRR